MCIKRIFVFLNKVIFIGIYNEEGSAFSLSLLS